MTYLDIIRSLWYGCVTVLHDLVTEFYITSAGVHANGCRQQPQVSQFQEIGTVLLIQTITHSSRALARLYAPLKFVVDPTYVLHSRIPANRLLSRQVKPPGTPFKISLYRIRDLLKVGTFVFAPFKRRAGVHFYLLLLPSRYNTNTVDALFYLQRHKIKGTTSSDRLLFFCFLLPPFSSIPTELAIPSALRVLKIYTYRLCNANVIYPPIVHISSPWHMWYTYKGHTTELV